MCVCVGMCVCMCVCMCVYVYVCACVCMCLCVCVCVRVHAFVCMCVYVFVCVCVYVFVCMCLCVCVCVYACVYVWVCMCACMCVCLMVYVSNGVYLETSTIRLSRPDLRYCAITTKSYVHKFPQLMAARYTRVGQYNRKNLRKWYQCSYFNFFLYVTQFVTLLTTKVLIFNIFSLV